MGVLRKDPGPALFRMDSERAHELARGFDGAPGRVAAALQAPGGARRGCPRRASGPSRRSGCDSRTPWAWRPASTRTPRAWPAAAALGFGHVEIGTVTALAQPGNPRPRMFRYPGAGGRHQPARLQQRGRRGGRRAPCRARRPGAGAGSRSGSTSASPRSPRSTRRPRTTSPASRRLARPRRLRGAQCLQPEHPRPSPAAGRVPPAGAPLRRHGRQPRPRRAPGKAARADPPEDRAGPGVSPDRRRARGRRRLRASTGSSRPTRRSRRPGAFAGVTEAGGLSGAPLLRSARPRSSRYIARATGGRLPIIGVGGITDADGAPAEKLDAGATLVQVYTGMIYRGPFFAAQLARALATGRGGRTARPGPEPSDHPVLDVADQGLLLLARAG